MSSGCYVYAIVRRSTPLPSAETRPGAAELSMVPWRGLAAVTGWKEGDSAPLTWEAMLRHEAVVEWVRQQGPALPVRFGTVFRDATSLASALAEQYETLATDLDRLGDKVELSLTALWAAPPSGSGSAPSPRDDAARAGRTAGARYLLARAAKLRRDETLTERARVVAERVDHVLGGRALERRVSLVPTPRVAVRTAYLLDPAGVGAFREAFDTMCRDRRDVHLLLTGPWPPYSFVGRNETDGGVVPVGRLAELAHILTDAMRGHQMSDRPPTVDN